MGVFFIVLECCGDIKLVVMLEVVFIFTSRDIPLEVVIPDETELVLSW